MNRLSLQQDRHRLFVGHLRPSFELGQGATPDWVLQPQEWIARKPKYTGDIARRYLKGFGAQHHRALAELFKANAVVQTAR